MRVEGAYTFPGGIEWVFTTLTNPDALARAIPGCERFIQLGPTRANGDTTYEMRLRAGPGQQAYTVTLDVRAARRPAYLKLEINGRGPSGPITGSGSLDFVGQNEHTVVAYRFMTGGAAETSESPTESAVFTARAACAHLADEIFAQGNDEMAWAPNEAIYSSKLAHVRERIQSNMRVQRVSQPPLAWTERAIWMTAGLALGLGVIALTVGIVRWLGGRGIDE